MSDNDLSVVGTVQGIEEKPSGWFEVKINVGRQYPVKVATKKQEIIDQVRALGTETGTFYYGEQESDRINEHTGKPYINRYLNEVAHGAMPGAGQSSQAANAGSTATPTAGGSQDQGRYTDEEIKRFQEKERHDFKSRSWAHTISALAHTIRTDEAVEDVFDRLKPFQRKIYEDILGSNAYAVQDDDIPF